MYLHYATLVTWQLQQQLPPQLQVQLELHRVTLHCVHFTAIRNNNNNNNNNNNKYNYKYKYKYNYNYNYNYIAQYYTPLFALHYDTSATTLVTTIKLR